MKELFGILSIVVGFAGMIPYFWGVYKGTAKPHMFSWIIWALVTGIVGVIQLVEDGGPGSWFLLFSAVICSTLGIIAYWRGTKDIRRVDWIVLITALSAIPLWVITNNPLWSVILVVGIDTIGYIPTIRKSWHKPYQEPAIPWAVSTVSFSLAFLALEAYTVTTYLYPVTFIFINALFVGYLLIRRKSLNS